MQKLNPYYIFNFGLLLVIVIYSLRLSNLYPSFSLSIIIFFICIISLFSLLCYNFKKEFRFLDNVQSNIWKNKKYILGSWCSLFGTLAEGVYSHGFPLLERYGDDVDFGIPTFHVILVVFITFITICIFQSYLFISNKKERRKLILLFFINFGCLMLDLSRSVILIIVLNCLWLFFFKERKNKIRFTKKKIIPIFLGLVTGLYLFGIIGNYRSNLQMNNANNDLLDSTLIYEVGDAKEEIRDNKYMGPLFWDYIYMSSPVANLQNIVNLKTNNNEPINKEEIITQYIPEVISEKIFPDYTWKSSISYQINSILNAATVFFSSYYILGWIGVIAMFIYMAVFPYVYLYLIRNLAREYFGIAIALLNTAYLLNLFGNMFSSTVTALLFFFPFLGSMLDKLKS